MSIRKKLLLFILSLTALALFVLAGCMGEMDAEEFLKNEGALNQYVVYYANGGTFDGSNTTVTKTIHYVPDSYVINDFDGVRNVSVARPEHVFNGWYYVALGTDGLPALDEDGNVTLTTPVDFSKKIKENEKWYIGAMWVADVRLEIKLVTSDGGKMTASDGKEYENGALLTTRSFPNGVAVMDTTAPVRTSEYTFTQFFHDEACTQRVTANIPQPDGGEGNPVIYAQYLKGSWEVVRTASNVRAMLFSPGGKNYYIATMSEEKVIDCSNITALPLRSGEFNAHIEGNGYTLKGIPVTSTLQTAGATYSMFGQITDKTEIRNLAFENITVTATTARSLSIFAIFSSADGATLENLSFKNVKLNITASVAVTNIPAVDGGYQADNWIFGGEDTDAQFLAVHSGVTLDGAALSINKTEYVFGVN